MKQEVNGPPILLSTAYLPPIRYMSKFLLNVPVYIEKFENFQKQSYRNRCYIYGANGLQCLVIPVRKQHGEKTQITQVEIDNTAKWQKIHLKSIESAYRLSPFYEFYIDEFIDAYKNESRWLFDFNLNLIQNLHKLTGISCNYSVTESYNNNPVAYTDFRNCIHPKGRLNKPDGNFTPITYQQAFQERFGFMPNLSIIDLIFNEGPQAIQILRKSANATS